MNEQLPSSSLATQPVTPDAIVQLGLAFMGSKVLLAAIGLDLFTALGAGRLDAETIRARLGLHPRSVHDFLDALVALGMLEKQDGRYGNTPATALFLDRSKPGYTGGFLEMANARLYGFWDHLADGLRSGEPQNEARAGGDLFEVLYRDPVELRRFLAAMTGLSLGIGRALAEKFPWADYRTFVDVGCAEGAVPVAIAAAHPHLSGIGFEVPGVEPHFSAYVGRHGLGDRLRFVGGDFFTDAFPRADVVVMGHILHDWNLEQKRRLIASAYEALPSGGAFIAFEPVIDDGRRENVFGLLTSLNMLIETRGGFDYTFADCEGWFREAGFRAVRHEHLAGPESMVVGIK